MKIEQFIRILKDVFKKTLLKSVKRKKNSIVISKAFVGGEISFVIDSNIKKATFFSGLWLILPLQKNFIYYVRYKHKNRPPQLG